MKIKEIHFVISVISIWILCASCNKEKKTECFTSTGKIIKEERYYTGFNSIYAKDDINIILVQDLQNGFAVAGRQRAPVRLTFTPSTKTYVFSDRASGTVLQTRVMSTGADYSLTSMSSTANTVDILPNGIGSTSFTVTLANGDYERRVFASTAGFVRITPNQ